MTDEPVYVEGELEATLRHLDLMHNESRAQTIARLEAALKVAKTGPDVPSLATHTEVVTREVTDAPPEPKPAKPAVEPKPATKKARKARAKAKAAEVKAAPPVNKQVLPAKPAEK